MDSIPLRSYLFAPASNPRLLEKVFNAGADAVVLDLEDAVSHAEKDRARRLLVETLATRSSRSPAVYVRINGLASSWWKEDVHAIARLSVLHGLRVPKVERLVELQALGEALSAAEDPEGRHRGSLPIVATIETARGVLNAAVIAAAPRVEALAFGEADFLHDVTAEVDDTETSTLYAKSHLVLVSRAATIRPPIMSVYTRLDDPTGLRRTTLAARRLGFFGRSCIHPSQVTIVNEVFTPTGAEIEAAKRIVDAAGSGAAATRIEGQFVDAAIADRARALLRLAEALVVSGKSKDLVAQNAEKVE